MFVLRGLSKRRHLGPVFWDLSTATLRAEARAIPEKQIYQHARPDGLIVIQKSIIFESIKEIIK